MSSRDKFTTTPEMTPPSQRQPIDGIDVSVSPLLRANIWSRMTFHWMNKFIMIGRNKKITEDHLPELCPDDDCRLLSDRMQHFWNEELELARTNKKKAPSLWRVLFSSVRGIIIMSGIICLAESIVKIAEAVLLGELIRFFQRPDAPDKEGYLWAMGLALAVCAHVILHHQFFFRAMRFGFQMRSGLIGILALSKALALPASAATSTGEVVNLVSNDVQCFETASAMVHFAWAGPVEVIIIMIVLYWRIGWPALVGISLLLLLFPLHSLFAKRYTYLRQKTTSYRDDRIRTVGDLLAGVELIKLSAWEDPLEKRVNEQRDKELGSLLSAAWIKASSESIRFIITGVVSLVTFTVYYASGHPLTPDKIFTSIALFNVLRSTLGIFFPQAIEKLAECNVSVQRIGAFLQLPEVSDLLATKSAAAMNDLLKGTKEIENSNSTSTKSSAKIAQTTTSDEKTTPMNDPTSYVSADLSSTEDFLPQQLVLNRINLDIMKDELLVVVGPVGSGKSSLCMAVLRELLPISGKIAFHVKPSHASGQLRIAYLSQHPWILSGTVRENILFGSDYDSDWYEQVVHGCALERNFALLAEGDSTHIGERGVTLSGGQRARIALARAVYMRADLYVLDDPLSAVDPQVARHLFDNALCRLLADRPRILVTHQLQFTQHCDRVLVLDEGRVAALGTPEEILAMEITSDNVGHTFLSELREYAKRPHDKLDSTDKQLMTSPALSSSSPSVNTRMRSGTQVSQFSSVYNPNEASDDGIDEEFEAPVQAPLYKSATACTHNTILSHFSEIPCCDTALDTEENSATVVKASQPNAEDQIEGSTPLSVYWRFFRFGASPLTIILGALALSGAQATMVAADWFLARWTNTPVAAQTGWQVAYPYIGLIAATCFLSIFRTTISFWILLNSSRWMFRAMLHTVLMAPMQFFHANPHGRILNRFSKDQSNVDELLPITLFDAIQCLFLILGALVIVCIVNPYIIIAMPVILTVFMILRWLYMNASRQVKRIESVTRSPVYSHLSETLYGLVTFSEAQNANARAFFAFLGCARWVGFRLDVGSGLLLILTAFVSVIMRSSQKASLVGLSLTYVLQTVDCLQWAIRQTIEVEMQFISVERIMAYTQIDPEPPRHTELRPPENWPEQGKIEFNDMSLPVLKNITLAIEGGEKIGVVGRTGAGKSSLLTALFRLCESTPADCIVIDGIPISRLGVHDLRSRLSIIPQTPIMFKGTLRFNLDPFDQYSDTDLWMALEAVDLKRRIELLPYKLDSPVTEDGKNFSAGERQLISLCRAILRNARVVVMDEATANMDLGTDRRIQRAIRNHFADATVLTIAHRLDTVVGAMSAAADNDDTDSLDSNRSTHNPTNDTETTEEKRGSDRILVLDAGAVQEFGPPDELLLIKDGANTPDGQGWLRRMVLQTGEAGERAILRVEKKKSA
ncbi:hypothetical protein BDF22DRAFT_690688 [Syncephalis plumigaleata]|nr:hypothetical protein BDF22DRAFT_690688 [Syncephalis plumigaleata]